MRTLLVPERQLQQVKRRNAKLQPTRRIQPQAAISQMGDSSLAMSTCHNPIRDPDLTDVAPRTRLQLEDRRTPTNEPSLSTRSIRARIPRKRLWFMSTTEMRGSTRPDF